MLITKLGQLVALTMSVGVSLTNVPMVVANEVIVRKNHFPEDGIYLYGQSPQRQQLGREYLVFRLRRGRVEGAVYLPGSEFSCFSGEVKPERMKLAIRVPGENDIYSYNLALQESSSLTGEGNRMEPSRRLVGYHQMLRITKNERRILDICLQEANY